MIKIRRVEEKQPATCISYPCDGDCSMSRGLAERARREGLDRAETIEDPIAKKEAIVAASAIEPAECPQKGSHYEQWRPDPDKKEFSVSAVIAHAAIESGHFEEVPEQQAKLKGKEQRAKGEGPATEDERVTGPLV